MSNLEHTYAVVMAGGSGTRLWPVSRRNRPKQMIPLVEERSLFQATIQRLEGLFPPERILVVTVAEQAAELREQAPRLPAENFILETCTSRHSLCGRVGGGGLAAARSTGRHGCLALRSLHSKP